MSSGYVCRSLCGVSSDAGSTPAASTNLVVKFQYVNEFRSAFFVVRLLLRFCDLRFSFRANLFLLFASHPKSLRYLSHLA